MKGQWRTRRGPDLLAALNSSVYRRPTPCCVLLFVSSPLVSSLAGSVSLCDWLKKEKKRCSLFNFPTLQSQLSLDFKVTNVGEVQRQQVDQSDLVCLDLRLITDPGPGPDLNLDSVLTGPQLQLQ